MDPHQSNHQPSLLLLNSRLRFNPTPTFLRVTFKHALSFSKHVFSLKNKFFSRLEALCCISASSCGRSLFCITIFFAAFYLCFTRMVSFPKRCQYYPIGTHLPSGYHHLRLPLALPYHTSSLRGVSKLLRVTLTHFTLSSYERVLRLPTFFLIQVWPDMERNQDSADLPEELLRALTRSCFLLHLGRFSLLIFLHLLGACYPSLGSPLFPLHAPALSRKDAALAHLDSLPPHDLDKCLGSIFFWQRRLWRTCLLLSLWR